VDGIKDILGQGIDPAKQDLIHWIPLQGGGITSVGVNTTIKLCLEMP
jgi:hypothetical protein